MRFREFLKTVNHQLSASSVCFLENAGFLDMDSVSYYCDYKAVQGSHSELIACEPDVFINSREREDSSSKLLIIANKKTKSFVSVSLYSKEKGIESVPLRNTCHGVIDLSDDGERWEGDVLDGYPCGWGRFFNADNMLCYEGFRYKEDTVCYGTGYFPDVFPETREYCGMISFGLRCGKGTQYNRTGAAIYTGYWMSNKRLADNTVVVPPHTATQLFHNTLMNGFVVQEHSYPHIRAFSLSHYPFLETVEIASYCFYTEDVTPPVTHAPFSLSYCEALREVSIDGFSFSAFSSFSLTSLPSLRSLRVAATQSFAFPLCRVFRLESLPVLTDVCIGSGCFQKAQSVVFRDLPALKRVQVGEASFEGDEENTSLGLLLSNKLVLRNLPSLQRFVGTNRNFQFFGAIEVTGRSASLPSLADVPSLEEFGICFYLPICPVATRTITNAPGFSAYFSSPVSSTNTP